MTLGDALDRAFGGPATFTSLHCDRGHHQVCMRFYGGRACSCACHAPGPKRIQLRRTKGWRKPEGAVVVSRPSRFGNPFRVADCIEAGFATDEAQARAVCVDAFRDWLNGNRWADGSGDAADARHAAYLAAIPELRGKDLACWCPLDQPCHADVLLELANR